MKFTTVVILSTALLLLTHQAAADSLYDTYISQHAWTAGHFVGACLLESYRKWGMSSEFGAAVWTGFCACHAVAARSALPGGQNLGPYMRLLIQCALVSSTRGTAVVGAEVVHCVAGKVNALING